MNEPLNLPPKLRVMLERIARAGVLLELAITASGGREPAALQSLIRAGYVRRCDHPTVKVGRAYPADALEITEAGRAALASGLKKSGDPGPQLLTDLLNGKL